VYILKQEKMVYMRLNGRRRGEEGDEEANYGFT
jgi:hypothetical protein